MNQQKSEFKVKFIETDKNRTLEFEKFKPTYGLPVVNKKFKNYELMKKWYGDNNNPFIKKRAFLKIPVDKDSKKFIEDETKKIVKKFKKRLKKRKINKVIRDGGKYDDYINCKLKMYYDKEKEEFKNLVTTEIFLNKKKCKNVTLEDLGKLYYKSKKIKVKISPTKLWHDGKQASIMWMVDKIIIEKPPKSKIIKSDSSSDESSDKDLDL